MVRINNHLLDSRFAVIDKKIYTTGGWYLQLHGLTTNEDHAYSLEDNKTTLIAPKNFPREDHGGFSVRYWLYMNMYLRYFFSKIF